MANDYRVTVTAIPGAESQRLGYKPIIFRVTVPEELALLLMSTPVSSVSLGVEATPGITLDKTKLLDFT